MTAFYTKPTWILMLFMLTSCGTESDFNERSQVTTNGSQQEVSADAAAEQSETTTPPDESSGNLGTGSGNETDAVDDVAEATPPPAPQPTPDPAAEGDPNVVVFRIVDGTGSGSWNDEASMVQVEVGQVLRIVNDDAVAHRLHTNGTPCPHGPRIEPGDQFDCNIASIHIPNADGVLYDHMAGPSAEFWLQATNAE